MIKLSGSRLRLVFAVVAFACLMAVAASAADVKTALDPRTDVMLRRMGDYLAQAPYFSVTAEVWQDIQSHSGQRIQAGRTIELQVRRPDRFHAEVRSMHRNRGLYYDGKSIILLDRVNNFYGTITAPASMDEALDIASERFGVTIPLEDFIVSDSYQNAIRELTSGTDLGPVTVLGVPCEHLVFSQGVIDWQLWIEEGAMPVPRKVVITYKDEPNSPEYTAILSHWDFQTRLPDFLFNCELPTKAVKIEVAEIRNASESCNVEGKLP
ncbi:MAG: DUF2092 domain-containing protein [Candidatus Riflebacteria bacterium]|nr:DUF2092 domain-containing protein [Candidatus Riflebacteria bacterium]